MASILEPAVVAASPMLPRPFRVLENRRENHDTFSLRLNPAGGAKASDFIPGQFNMLYLPGVGEVAISISSLAPRPGSILHTIRAVGAVTKALKTLKAGDALGLRGPFGNGWPLAEAEGGNVVFVAGGIGLAPLRPALQRVLERRERYKRVLLLYGTRSPSEIIYGRELKHWRQRFDVEVHVTVDRAADAWRGRVGVVTTLLEGMSFQSEEAAAFVCGPEIMMRFSAAELERRGLPPERIYVSMERNMKCAVGFCGHCQFGPEFICKDGPVFHYPKVRDRLGGREL